MFYFGTHACDEKNRFVGLLRGADCILPFNISLELMCIKSISTTNKNPQSNAICKEMQ